MHTLLIISFLLVTWIIPSGAAFAKPLTLLERVDQKIKEEKVFERAIDYRLNLFKDELSVSTFQHPRANLKDMKIDALLTAHSVIEVTRDKISRISVYYFDREDNSRFYLACVDRNLLNELKKNNFDKDSVLKKVTLEKSSLPNPIQDFESMSYKEITASLPLSDGILKAERLALSLRIDNLKKTGVDVTSLNSLFLKLDDSIRRDDNRVRPLYLYTLTMVEAFEKRKISASQTSY